MAIGLAPSGCSAEGGRAVWGDALLPKKQLAGGSSFPLLIKFLDAKEDLSVQVHPSPAYAKAHADAFLKTECWTILAAEPGATLYKGVRAGVTRAAVLGALLAVVGCAGAPRRPPLMTAGLDAASVQGTWHVVATTFPMWTEGRRRVPTFTYSALRRDSMRERAIERRARRLTGGRAGRVSHR